MMSTTRNEATPPDKRHAPFSDDYITLCRKARLSHEFVTGDWYAQLYKQRDLFEPQLVQQGVGITAGRHGEHSYIWLPRLDDLIALLDERGVKLYLFWNQAAWDDWGAWAAAPGFAIDKKQHGSTPEEAALLLLLATPSRFQESTASGEGQSG